jgi:hypothetical protein
MDTIEIKGSKIKIFLAIIGSLLFVVCGVLFTTTPETFISPIYRDTIFMRIVGVAALLFFGYALITLVKALFINSFNLIITENGIIDHSTYSSVGMIKWEDIISIKSTKIHSEKFLLIYVKNPKKYINSSKKIKRKMLKGNFRFLGTPITITSNSLNCSFRKLEKIITESYNMYLDGKYSE